MIAARYNPKALYALLDVIKTFNNDTKQHIFVQVTNQGWNALMIAAWNYPETVPALLEIIDTFQPAIKNQILMQKYNRSLRLAAYQKKLVLNSILNMEEAQLFRVLQDIHDNNPDSVYAKIFHTKTGLFFKPSIKSGVLGRAEKEYQSIKEKYDAQSSQQHATAPPVLSVLNSGSNPYSKKKTAFFKNKSREFLEIVPTNNKI